MTDYENYAAYLRRRSLAGKIYRQWLLYPRLSRYLKGRVLDFGCGIGDFLRFRADTTGTDINPFNVEFCRSQGLDTYLIEGGHIPFPNHSFDAAVMDNVLEHIPKSYVNDVLRELLRVLRPGGLLLIGVPGEKGYAADDDHKCFYTEDDLFLLLGGEHGCQMLKTFHMPLRLPRLQHMLSQYCIYVLFRLPVDEATS